MLKTLSIVIAAGLLAACAVGPDYVRPETDVADSFVNAEPAAYSQEPAQPEFWSQFGDQTLDDLVRDALAENHDLRIALARLQEARAARRESRLDLLPTVTAGGGYTRQHLADDQGAGLLPGTQDLYDAGFDAFWELDLFGRVRRGVEAQSAVAQGAQADLEDAQVVVIAEVARGYFELRGVQDRLDVARRNVQNQQATLDLTQSRLDAGRGTSLDTSRAQAQLSTTLATIAPLEAEVARAIHRLGVLTGREPNALRDVLAPSKALPPLPQVVAIGEPTGLLRRRPDIRVAERNLAAATAGIGVAVGDLFPRVTFTGSFGYVAADAGALGESATRSYLIGPGISWAALDLGRVRARIAGAEARNQGALAQYERTVLRALEDTENSLVAHSRARDRLTHVSQAADASGTAARLAQLRFEGGMVDFLQVLDAERTLLEAEDRLAQSRVDVATTLISVYKALGGGWENAPLPRYTRR